MKRGVRKLGSPISSRIASGSLFAASKTSRIAERRASDACAAMPAALTPALDMAMTLEARPGRVAALDFLAHAPFGAHDLLGLLEHPDSVGAGDDEDPIELPEHDVARV